MPEPILWCYPFGLTFGRIASKGENIVATGVVGVLEGRSSGSQFNEAEDCCRCNTSSTYIQGLVHLISRHIGACQVHARFQAKLLMRRLHELGGGVCSSAASAPGDVDEGRAEFTHALDAGIQVCDTLGCSVVHISISIVAFITKNRRSGLSMAADSRVFGGKYSKEK